MKCGEVPMLRDVRGRSRHMTALSTLLVQLRSLMPSVSKECEISVTHLEAI